MIQKFYLGASLPSCVWGFSRACRAFRLPRLLPGGCCSPDRFKACRLTWGAPSPGPFRTALERRATAAPGSAGAGRLRGLESGGPKGVLPARRCDISGTGGVSPPQADRYTGRVEDREWPDCGGGQGLGVRARQAHDRARLSRPRKLRGRPRGRPLVRTEFGPRPAARQHIGHPREGQPLDPQLLRDDVAGQRSAAEAHVAQREEARTGTDCGGEDVRGAAVVC
mmetsp:Transcript_5913/g.17794  ORF Transcript_5913/g.17794 Transcript_5913/m.17794 type:complete len:224 (+) Transcript_5913:89-760(+)